MEAIEWRIGNYYWSGYNLKISKLMGFIPEESDYEIEGVPFTGYLIEGCDKLIPWGSLDPIPLTEEWLINFGYETDCDISENPMHFRKDGHLIWKPAGIFYDDLYRIELKYVHQLQNLFFALKRKELYLVKK